MKLDESKLAGLVAGLNIAPAIALLAEAFTSPLQGYEILSAFAGIAGAAFVLYANWRLLREPNRFALTILLIDAAILGGGILGIFLSLSKGHPLSSVTGKFPGLVCAILVIFGCVKLRQQETPASQ